MTDSTTTRFSNRCEILGELWMNYKNDEEFFDFFEYNDLGLPLAYVLGNDIAISTPKAEMLVNETWELLLSGLGVTDSGFENLDELLDME